jgi:hypothetical protein
MAVLFSITLFVSAFLLFVVQPMIAKLVLPLLGGTPAVWNTCMVFFQAMLLGGYAYAHVASAWFGMRRHALVHMLLLLLPFLVLLRTTPEDWSPAGDADPILWLLTFLALVVGLPFFVLSTTAPLLQRWFAETGHPSAGDPYFLYSASNLGSMVALVSYPFLVEPLLPLASQQVYWTFGFGVLVVLTVCCAVALWHASGSAKASTTAGTERPQSPAASRTFSLTAEPQPATHPVVVRLRWLALAFVPSSLMLSVTTYLTSDIAAVPLLWVIPLALYLLSFILVFARRPVVPYRLLVRIMPLLTLGLALVMISLVLGPIQILIPFHLLVFLVIALVFHGGLARHRPEAQELTQFYLWLACGGVLGGLFNAIVAPLIFKTVVEYPLVLVLACLIRPSFTDEKQNKNQAPPPRREPRRKASRRPSVLPIEGAASRARMISSSLILDILLPPIVGFLAVGFFLIVGRNFAERNALTFGVTFGIPALVCCSFLDRPLRFGLALGALFLAGGYYVEAQRSTVHRERSFFGLHRIAKERGGTVLTLIHGNTHHGRQSLDPARRYRPLTYYHPTGPVGQIFKEFSGQKAKRDVAIVGLGAGSIAAYGQLDPSGKPFQHFTFFEIDPSVVRIARDDGYFTFLADSHAQIDIKLGDARLTLQKTADKQFGMIILDAFSSDSIPLHLVTRQAFRLYKSKLADDGILVFHISNGYLDLEPVLGDLAHDAGLLCWLMNDLRISSADEAEGKSPSQWMVLARTESHLGNLLKQRTWKRIHGRQHSPVWTDSYSNLWGVFRWD